MKIDLALKTDIRFVAVLFFLSLFVLLPSLYFTSKDPVFHFPTVDEKYYLATAGSIADGRLAGADPFRTPLYPYIISPLFHFGWLDQKVAIRIIQAFVGSLSIVLIFLLGRSLSGQAAGLISSSLVLMYWPFVYYHSDIIGEPFFILLALLSFYFLVKEGAGAELKRTLFAGIVFGLSILIRPNILAVLPAASLNLLMHRDSPLRKRIMKTLVFVAGVAFILSLNLARNYFGHGTATIVSDQGGINFYIGNNPESRGLSASLPGLRGDWLYPELKEYTEELLRKPLDYREVIEYWDRESRRLPVKHTKVFLSKILRKSLLFINNFEMGNNREIYQFREQNPVLKLLPVNFSLLFALGCVGCFSLSFRKREHVLLISWVVLYSVGVILFFVNSRYRLPVIPFIAILAGSGITHLLKNTPEMDLKKKVTIFLCCVLAIALTTLPSVGTTREALKYDRYATLGLINLQAGEFEKALLNFRKAYELAPTVFEVHYRLADSYRLANRHREAVQEYENLIVKFPLNHHQYRAYLGMAHTYRKSGNDDLAAEKFSMALTKNPRSTDAAAGLFLSSLHLKDFDTALRILREASGEGAVVFKTSVKKIIFPGEVNYLSSQVMQSSLWMEEKLIITRYLSTL